MAETLPDPSNLLELHREREETVVCSPLGILELRGSGLGPKPCLGKVSQPLSVHPCFVTYLPALSPEESMAHGRAFDKHLECFW